MGPSKTACDCRDGEIYRIEREWWMRLLFPSRFFYRCSNCGESFLLTDADLIEARLARRQLHAGAPAGPPQVAAP